MLRQPEAGITRRNERRRFGDGPKVCLTADRCDRNFNFGLRT
jgi:hypothetical protein